MKKDWKQTINLFETPAEGSSPKPETVHRIIDLEKNYNNKLSSEFSFMILLPESDLWEVHKRYEIRLRGKFMHLVYCDSKALYPFDKISTYVSHIDRGMPVADYKKQLKTEFKKHGEVEKMTFALLLLVIVKDKQLSNSH